MNYVAQVMMWLLVGTAGGLGLCEGIYRIRTMRRETGAKGRR